MENLAIENNLVFGASGLVGSSFLQKLPSKSTTGYSNSKAIAGLKQINILDFEKLTREVCEKKPNHIFWAVNLSGGVNRCEQDQELANKFHLEATKEITNMAKVVGAKLIFISTDYVFSDSDFPVKEDDSIGPLNIYGSLKRKAEEIIINSGIEYLIARTTNVYGWDKDTTTPNFFMQIYKKFNAGELVSIPEALKGNPTFIDDLTAGILTLLSRGKSGIYHIVGPEYMSRFEWAGAISKKFGFSEELLMRVSEFNNVPKRPLKLELNCSKFINDTSFVRTNLDQALDLIKDQIYQEGLDL